MLDKKIQRNKSKSAINSMKMKTKSCLFHFSFPGLWRMKMYIPGNLEENTFCWNFLSNTNFEIERSGGRSILYPWWCIRHNRWNLFKAQKHLGADSKVSLLKIRCCYCSSMLYDNILPSSNYARWRLKISQLTDQLFRSLI